MPVVEERVTGRPFLYESELDSREKDPIRTTGFTQLDQSSKPPPESITGYVTNFDENFVFILFRDGTGFEELVKLERRKFPEPDVEKNMNVVFSVYEEHGEISYGFKISPEEFPGKELLQKYLEEAKDIFQNL
ncbi:MAG: hypothetical protein AB9903_04430 [Vulcanimicrobiota bacterium]